ncbi:hypothetical protein [Rhizobium sp. FKL33]|uniref:hypothetical protein n=1 Tax=Rhizobium sp. FKL33 TaxID=2562307 RepID=UPI0010C03D79|nr:hypothetical protein [Rhizobium sp. FKL33]
MSHETGHDPRMLDLRAFPAIVVNPFGVEEARAASIRIVARADEPREFNLAPEAAYFVMLYLDPVDHCDLLANGEALPGRRYGRGSLCLIDLSEGARIRLSSSLNALGFVLPFQLAEEARQGERGMSSAPLRLRRNEQDAIAYRLGLSILPCFEKDPPDAPPSLPHMIGALCAHLLDGAGMSLH